MASKMIWSLHLKEKDKEAFEQSLRSSKTVIDRLRVILETKLEGLEAEELSDKFFEEVNLDQRFYRNQGRKKELHQLLDILTF